MRRGRWVQGLLLAAAVAASVPGRPAGRTAVLSSASERSGAPAPAPPPSAAPTTTTEPPPPPSFTLGEIDIRAVRTAAQLPDGVRQAVQATLDRYLNTAVVAPLRSGRVAEDLASVFTSAALARVTSVDHDALVDDSLPPTEELTVDTASANLVALVGPAGVAALSAEIRVVVTATVLGVPLTLERSGELQLSQDGDVWKVSGYDVRVERHTPTALPTTTLHSP